MKKKPLLILALVAVCVYFLVDAVMSYVSYRLEPEEPVVAMPSPATEGSPGLEDAAKERSVGDPAIIVERNLFGQGAREEGPAPRAQQQKISLADVPQASAGLGLELVGTIIAGSEEGRIDAAGAPGEADEDRLVSKAVIFDKQAREQGLYREGEDVRPNVSVKQITRFNVVVSVSGRDQVLTMDLDKKGTSPAAPTLSQPEPEPEAADQEPDTQTVSVPREEIDESFEDITKMLQEALFTPIRLDDGSMGFKIDKIRPGSLYTKLQLRNGDVLKGVNGENITSPDQLMELYNSLDTQNSVVLELERRGQPERLEYKIR